MSKIAAYILALVLTATMQPITAQAGQIAYPAGYHPYYNEQSAQALARLVWHEGRGLPSQTEQAAIMWCAINRVEHPTGWSDNLLDVLRQRGQFAYRDDAPVDPALYALAKDVLIRWDMERCGYADVGRVLPENYCYFTGDGTRNHFRAEFSTTKRWDWSLPTPYES